VAVLPETAAVPWRPRMDAARLRRSARAWTISTVFQVGPLVAFAVLLLFLDPVTVPVGVLLLGHAWVIGELYANRGAKVVRPRAKAGAREEATALGLLGDLVGHDARELHVRTGLVLERGRFGAWLVGEAGALLVSDRGRRVHCWCVRATDPELPSSDRIAHLLLALREDEAGFATVANHAFAGRFWRLRRRLPKAMRPALEAARRADREAAARGRVAAPAISTP
jgi:hypothetical protein